jgi:hypothetical protein
VESLVPGPLEVETEVEIAVAELKSIICHAMIKFQQNCFKQEAK